MSISLMTMAWKTKLLTTPRFLLITLCDKADDDGGSLYPSIEYIAKRVGCSPRTAQRIVHELIAGGWLAVVGNSSGGAPGATRHYQLNVKRLRAEAAATDAEEDEARKVKHRHPVKLDEAVFAQTGDKARGDNLSGVTSATERGDIHDIGGVTSTTETGDTGVTLYTIETSIDPPSIHHWGLPSGAQPEPQPPAPVPIAPAKRPGDYTAEFEAAWAVYPRRPGDSKKDAFKAWTARLKAGAKAEDMMAGAERYAAYTKARRTEPQYLKQACTFFGPGEHYASDWAVAAAKPSRHSGFGMIDYGEGVDDDGRF